MSEMTDKVRGELTCYSLAELGCIMAGDVAIMYSERWFIQPIENVHVSIYRDKTHPSRDDLDFFSSRVLTS